MPLIDEIFDRALTPKLMSIGNFTAFALIAAIGILMSDYGVVAASTGFFIAGFSIGLLYIMDGWVHGTAQNEPSPVKISSPQTISETAQKVIPHGVPKNNVQIQTAVEL